MSGDTDLEGRPLCEVWGRDFNDTHDILCRRFAGHDGPHRAHSGDEWSTEPAPAGSGGGAGAPPDPLLQVARLAAAAALPILAPHAKGVVVISFDHSGAFRTAVGASEPVNINEAFAVCMRSAIAFDREKAK